MRNMNMCARVLWMLFAVALMSTMAKGSGMEFVLIQEDGAYGAEFVADVTGGVSVEMQLPGATAWTNFDGLGGSDDYEWESAEYGTLAELNTALTGDYTLKVTHGGGVSQYGFTVLDSESGWFPPTPSLVNPGDPIDQQITISWTWTGLADVKVVEYGSWDAGPTVDFWQEYVSTDPAFPDLSHGVDYGTYTGDGDFYIMYRNELATGVLVDKWSLESGSDIFGANVAEIASTEVGVEYAVVPEPATMSLLAIGGLAMLRRKRRA